MEKVCSNCGFNESDNTCKMDKCEDYSHFSEKGKPVGLKFDKGKDRWDLLVWFVIRDVVKIMTFGAEKYADNSWQGNVPFKEKYFASLMRHISDWRMGEKVDPESGMHHLAHAICNCMFLIWGDKNPRKIKGE